MWWAGAGPHQPGLTIACGDSHTSTHGAFGANRVWNRDEPGAGRACFPVSGAGPLEGAEDHRYRKAAPGTYAKDVILTIIRQLGVQGGVGYAYEYAGEAIERMSMEERMSVCNMSIEGGARVGYVSPTRRRSSTSEAAATRQGRRLAASGQVVEGHGLRQGLKL